MTAVRYAPGDRRVVVLPAGLVVLDAVDDATALAVRDRLSAGAGLGGIIEALSAAHGSSFDALPGFAVLLDEGPRVRVAVRGALQVTLHTDAGDEVVDGEGVNTWTERVVADVASARIGGDGEPVLPVADGVVRAGAIAVDRLPEAAPAPVIEEAPDIEVPSDAPADPRAVVAPWLTGPGADADADAVAPAPGVRTEDVPTEALRFEDLDPEEAAALGIPDPAAAPAPEPVVAPEPVAAPDPVVAPEPVAEESQPETEAFTLADIEAQLADDPAPTPTRAPWSAAPPAPAAPPVPPVPADAAASAPDATILRPDPAPDAPTEVLDVVDDPSGAAGVEVVGDHDGETISLAQARALRAAAGEGTVPPLAAARPTAAGRLRLSTGQTVLLDRTVVIGRRPRSTRVTGTDLPHLIAVDSPQQDISRNHVEIRGEGDTILVTDLDTTNGTILRRAGADPVRLHPGEQTIVVSGDVLDLGDGVTVEVEDAT